MEINLEKKHFAIIAAFCLILTTGLVAANQDMILKLAAPTTDILPGRTVGHSSEDVVVNLDDLLTGGALCTGDMGLQEAIDNGCFGTGGGFFGDWVDMGSASNNHGPVATDGIVVTYSDGDSNPIGYTDSSSSPTRVISGLNGWKKGFTMPVKKGDYWRVEDTTKSWWIPLIGGESEGSSGTSLPPCSNDQLIQYNSVAGEWECADSCANGQILQYNSASDSWECADLIGVAGASLGEWDSTDLGQVGGTGTTLARETIYQAIGDGFVVAEMIAGHCGQGIEGYTDSESNPTTLRVQNGSGYIDTGGAGITMPVKANDFWRVKRKRTDGYCDGPVNIYWIPLIGGGSAGDTCYWTGYTACSADEMGITECAIGEVMTGFDLRGCAEGLCGDITRCRKYKIKCCN